LAYHYGNQVAQLRPLEDEHEPGHYDLCPTHAAHLSVPAGWQVVRSGNIAAAVALSGSALLALAAEVRAIGLRDEPALPRPLSDNSSIIELRRIGHLRVIADVSKAS
jgi:hypothetical protein